MSDDGVQSSSAPDVPATGWAVLGMLSFNEEVSGYDVKRWADWSVGHFYWSPSFSQVYSELKRLERLGFATSRSVRNEGERSRRLYAITPAGYDALKDWAMTAPVDLPMLKHPVILRVWMGHVNSPERLKEMLTDYVEQLDVLMKGAQHDAELARMESAWSYPRLAIEWAHHHYTAEREMALGLIAEIDATQESLESALGSDGQLIPPDRGRWQQVGEIGLNRARDPRASQHSEQK